MLENIYNKAIMDKIPIMQSDGLEYLLKIIKENNITRILEIGSAVGYSAIRMALVNENIKVTTIDIMKLLIISHLCLYQIELLS